MAKTPEEYKARRAELMRAWRLANSEKARATVRKTAERREAKEPGAKKMSDAKYRRKLKNDVFTAYGARCVCCGEDDTRFLTLDHINSDGADQRRKLKGHRGQAGLGFYTWVRQNNYPDDLQLLCWNCNSGRHYNGGVCPHNDHPEGDPLRILADLYAKRTW